MKKTSKYALQFDALESRTILSVGLHGHLAPAVVIEKARPPKPPRPVTVSGTIAGSYSVAGNLIIGTGSPSTLGPVTLVGSTAGIIGTPGSRISATVALVNGHGVLYLGLTGVIPKSTAKPISVSVAVEGGTGSYANDSGSGTGTIQPRNVSADLLSGSFVFTFHTTLKSG